MINYRLIRNQIWSCTIITILCFDAQFVAGQSGPLDELNKIQSSYKDVPFLAYDISYSYSSLKKPDSVYFSGNGSFKLSASNYYGTIDSMLYLQNASYSMVISRSNKIIYLSKPKNVFPALNDISVFDSLVRLNNVKYSISSKGKNKEIAFDFSSNFQSGFKNFVIQYDPYNYWIKMISYTMLQNGDDGGDGNEKLIIAKSLFKNYSTKSFDKTVFDTNKYFMQDGDEYKPQDEYKDYEVLIGSPELLKN